MQFVNIGNNGHVHFRHPFQKFTNSTFDFIASHPRMFFDWECCREHYGLDKYAWVVLCRSQVCK